MEECNHGHGCAYSMLELWALACLLATQGRRARVQTPAGKDQGEVRQAKQLGRGAAAGETDQGKETDEV